jgi:hypothetical protein
MPQKKKKSPARKHVSHNNTHIMLKKGLVVYAAIIFLGFILLTLSIYTVSQLTYAYQAEQRLDRIKQVYVSLDLDDSYRVAGGEIFGEKRIYEWDESRTYASSAYFGRDADRSETFADLRAHIESAGFEQIEGPDYADISRQDHYRSDDGEYIRVSIDTAAWHSAMLYGTELPEPGSPASDETGPVYVTIKVNLDDNNE